MKLTQKEKNIIEYLENQNYDVILPNGKKINAKKIMESEKKK